jgi:hypothetical protein
MIAVTCEPARLGASRTRALMTPILFARCDEKIVDQRGINQARAESN